MQYNAGAGLPLLQVYDAMFGTSKAAKAFRSVVKKINKEDAPQEALGDLLPLASQVVRILAYSQEFKSFVNSSNPGIKGMFKESRDPYTFLSRIGWYLSDLKKMMEVELNRSAPKITAATKKFLLEWVNTNARRLPPVTRDIILDLAPFRPISRLVLYRGIQFSDVGELVEFTEKYGAGKSFKFNSNRWSSWTKYPNVAERFAKYHASTSQSGGMITQPIMSWLSRAKNNKVYDGNGGYVVGAYVQPKDCLVDLNHPGLPFSGGNHGDEGEVIVRPDVELVCKVYKVYGDVLREVEEYKTDKYRSKGGPASDHFFGYLHGYTPKVEGDEESGLVQFVSENPVKFQNAKKDLGGDPYQSVLKSFRRNLYKHEWVNDNTVRYKRMDLPSRVAARHLTR